MNASDRWSLAPASAGAVTSAPEGIAVSIVSNSLLLSDGLCALLAARMRLHSIARYDVAPPMDDPTPSPVAHVVLIDSGVGRDTAKAWTRYWRTRLPPAYVLVLEMANDVDLILDCIEAGAGGYILKGESVDEVVRAIVEVQQGRSKCSPEVTGRLCARLMAARQAIDELSLVVSPLTRRELEVLCYVAENMSNQEIAALLVIEVRTVKHHVHNILEKLQLSNRRDAARYAGQQGWLDNGHLSPETFRG